MSDNLQELIAERTKVRRTISDTVNELEEKKAELEKSKTDLQEARELAAKLKKNIPMLKSEVYSLECDIDRGMREFALLTFKIEGLAPEEGQE